MVSLGCAAVTLPYVGLCEYLGSASEKPSRSCSVVLRIVWWSVKYGTPMRWSYWSCTNYWKPEMLRRHQKGNTHGCCGYTVITLKLLETPTCLLFTRPNTKKNDQPLCFKFNQCALSAPLSMVPCVVLHVAFYLGMGLCGPKYSIFCLSRLQV